MFAGNSCTAKFSAGFVDVGVASATSSAGKTTVEIKNHNLWIDAVPSVVRVEVVGCDGAVSKTLDAPPIAVPKRSTKTVTLDIAAGKTSFLRVTADATKALLEMERKNNVWSDAVQACGKRAL
jgi:hypothetical protein